MASLFSRLENFSDKLTHKQILKLFVFFAVIYHTMSVVVFTVLTSPEKQSHPKYFVTQDTTGYYKTASSVMNGGEFISASRTPLYPLFIGIFDFLTGGEVKGSDIDLDQDSYAWWAWGKPVTILLIVLNHVLSILKIFFILVLIWNITQNKAAMIFAGSLSFLDLFVIVSDNQLLPYTMSQAFTIFNLFYFYKWLNDKDTKNLVLSAVWASLATLALPAYMYFWLWPVLCISFQFFRGLRVSKIIVSVFIYFFIANFATGFWMYKNYQTKGVALYTWLQYRQFHDISNHVMSDKEGISLTEANQRTEAPVLAEVAKVEQELGRKLSKLEWVVIDKKHSMAYLKENFGHWVWLQLRRTTSYFHKPFFDFSLRNLIESIISSTFIILGLIGIFRFYKKKEWNFMFIFTLPFLFYINIASPLNAFRYMSNWTCFSILLAGLAYAFLRENHKNNA